MSIKLSNNDYIWSYVGMIVSALSYVAILPFALYFLSSEMYGLWGIFQSLVAISLLFDFGFSTTFARNINYCWSGAKSLKKEGVIFVDSNEPNFELMKKTIVACRLVFSIIGLIALILMLSVGSIYILRVSKTISGNEPIIAWIIYAIAITLNIYYGYYNSFLRGVGAIKQANQATVFARLLQMILAVVLLFLGFGVIGTAVAYLSYGVVFRLLGKNFFYGYKGIGASIDGIDKRFSYHEIFEIFKTVGFNATKEGGITLANYLSTQACTIICSLYLPLSITGEYTLAIQMCTAIANVSAALYVANQPILQAAYISKDENMTRRTMSLILISYCLLYFIGILILITIGLPILKIIKPELGLTIGLIIGAAIYQFVLQFRNCYTSYFSCTNRIPYTKSFVVSAILCVCLSYIALKFLKMGVSGLLIGQLASQLIYNAWYWMLKAHGEMKLSAKETISMGVEEIYKMLFSLRRNPG